jgi:hypothetical protein
MATFSINETRTTEVPFIVVDTKAVGTINLPSRLSTLLVGKHRFQLVVEDNNGNRSAPAFVEVTVTATTTSPTGGGLGGTVGRSGLGDIGGLGGMSVRPPS